MKVYMVSYGWEDSDALLFANEEDAKKWVELFDGFLEEKEVWDNNAMNKGFYYCIKASANFDFFASQSDRMERHNHAHFL